MKWDDEPVGVVGGHGLAHDAEIDAILGLRVLQEEEASLVQAPDRAGGHPPLRVAIKFRWHQIESHTQAAGMADCGAAGLGAMPAWLLSAGLPSCSVDGRSLPWLSQHAGGLQIQVAVGCERCFHRAGLELMQTVSSASPQP